MILRNTAQLLLVVLASSVALAQATLTGSPLTGDIRPITFQNGAAETNVLFGALAGGAAADDDNNNSIVHPIGGSQYFADPSIALQETRSHVTWDLSYHPTLRFYVPSSSYHDQFNQVAGGTLHYDITKHLAIGLRQDYLRTSDPFQQFGETPLHPGIGLGSRPGVVLLGNFRRTQFLSQAEIDYRLAKHTSVGITGDFIQIQGNELGSKHTNLFETHDTLGSAFFSHQITARQALGVQYQFLDIVFPGRDTQTRTHGALLFDQIGISPRLTFSVFAGPEYSRIHNQLTFDVFGHPLKIPISSTLWSPAAGGILDWRQDRFGLQASFVRRVSDGGGLVGAVEMNDALLRMKAKLARRWVANMDGEFTRHTLLNASGRGKIEVLNLGAGVNYELANRLWARLLYQRIHNLGGDRSTLEFGNHNRLTLSLEREFIRPLGR